MTPGDQGPPLGVALVTNDRRHADRVLSTIVEFIGRAADAELTDYAIELL